MHRAQILVCKPTAGKRQRLETMVESQRQLYNAALEERRGAWRWEQRRVTKYDQYRELTGFIELTGSYGVTVCRGTLTRLDEAFRDFHRRVKAGAKAGFPRFKGVRRFESLSWPDGSSWKLEKASGAHSGRLYLQGVGHFRVVGSRRGPRGVPKTLTLRRRGNRWEASVVYEIESPTPLAPTGRAAGIDLGIASLVTTTDGRRLANPSAYDGVRVRLTAAQSDLSRRKRGSRRWREAKRAVSKAHRKASRVRRNQAHQISRWLVNAYDLICHEGLVIPAMTASARGTMETPGRNVAAKAGLNRSILDCSWGLLLSCLAYKAADAGREVIRVNPKWTSVTCPRCGHRESANRPTQARFVCLRCSYNRHADEVGAINILRAGLAQRESAERATAEWPRCADMSLAGPSLELSPKP
jgi:putative transposase